MDKNLYEAAIKVVEACHKKDFVGFLSKEQAEAVSEHSAQRPETADQRPPVNGHRDYDHPKADAAIPRSLGSEDLDE